ncbi:MAG: hypothetical protein OEW68_16845 [Gammaproteobacteria bacterium]|nr:hypothetical protein [Gammaproteobacteria bacterium]MDH4316485.1 hypothetical protein [Gammaproteobacteria bacterium]
MIVFRNALFLAAAALVAGCGGNDACEKPQAYQASFEGKRIDVPEGLDPLMAGRELTIPDASPQDPPAEGAPCLEIPPAYRSTPK